MCGLPGYYFVRAGTFVKDLPVKDMKEFVSYAKANKDKMQFASAGTGSAIHLGCALTNMVTGLDIVHVPYHGANLAMQDLMSGRVDYLCDIITTAKPQIDGGAVKAIAILTKERSPVLPNVPTAAEQGFEVEAYTWNAFFLPKGTPDAIYILGRFNCAIWSRQNRSSSDLSMVAPSRDTTEATTSSRQSSCLRPMINSSSTRECRSRTDLLDLSRIDVAAT